jgi:hypothetical protein
MDHGEHLLPITGTGPRLITAAEAAALLCVSEDAVNDWIARELISHATLPNGEHRIRLLDEKHEVGPSRRSSFVALDLYSGIDDESAKQLAEEMKIRRRERQLEGLVWTQIDARRLTAMLAERLIAVVPDGVDVRVDDRMVWVAGSGVDVERSVADDEQSLEQRIIDTAEHMLDTASDAISEVIGEPWPARAGQFPGGFPPYEAAIVNGQLVMSYGKPDDPILTLSPIPLADVLLRP